ncbi:MAG TPA: hypothetical protein VI259_16615, partial [Gemmatimonadaceae bacterium]
QLSERDKQIAETKARAAQLEKDRADKDKQLSDNKARVAQLEKEKADKDKLLAAATETAKKERDARDKADKSRQEAEARDKERDRHEQEEKLAREKQAEGPALPGYLSGPIQCDVPDEIRPATDLYVHCATKSGVSAKALVFYYRPGGTVIYNAVVMEHSRKGWYIAFIPGDRLVGKLLHYYVEARDGSQAVIASNGKSSSPNIATLRTPRH